MFASRTPPPRSPTSSSAPRIVGLALATGYIHSTLGGLLFTLNAIGYFTAAVAMVIPLALAVRFRWVVRLGLIGYAATTIVGWAIQGPYYQTAYIAKAIEVALIVLVAVDFARMDGNPITVVKRELAASPRSWPRPAAPPAPAPSDRARVSASHRPNGRAASRAAARPRQGDPSDEAPRPGPGPRGPRRPHRRLFRWIRPRPATAAPASPGASAPAGDGTIDRRQGPRVPPDDPHGPADEPSRSSSTTRNGPAQHRHQGRARGPPCSRARS